MITRDRNVVTVEGQVQGVEIEMSIEQSAFGHIMEQLTRLYSDPILAFIREVSTNADDARIEARSTRPTEVTLPNRLNPMFMVRDYGTGMSFESIVDIYSRYGASTKRDSNDFNGALGFGCKAPLAYTPQFSVTTVKDGLRNVVSVGRKPSGGGTMTVAEQNAPTSEPNGTTVVVPVKSEDVAAVQEKAAAFYRYWKPGTVKINGEDPDYLKPLLRLNPRFAVIEGGTDYILMANVAYPVANRLDHGIKHGFSLLAEVPTGDVDFVGSREALEMTAHTRATLQKVAAEFKAASTGAVQRKIDEAGDKPNALAAMVYWHKVLGRAAHSTGDNYTFKGAILPACWKEQKRPGYDWPFLVAPIKSYVDSRHSTAERVEADNFGSDIFVLGFLPTKFVAQHKERLNMWRNDTDADRKTTGDAVSYILCRSDVLPADVAPWIDPARVVKWSDVKANYKIERATSPGGYGSWKQVAGSYEDVWTESGKAAGETEASKIRQDKPIFFFQSKEWYHVNAVEALKISYPNFTVVKLQANRVAKFRRDFPAAKTISAVMDDLRRKFIASITDDQKKARWAQNNLGFGGGWALKELPLDQIDDPALKELGRLMTIDLRSLEKRASVFRHAHTRAELPETQITDPLRSYPLLSLTRHNRIHSQMKQHLVLYINAVYAART